MFDSFSWFVFSTVADVRLRWLPDYTPWHRFSPADSYQFCWSLPVWDNTAWFAIPDACALRSRNILTACRYAHRACATIDITPF